MSKKVAYRSLEDALWNIQDAMAGLRGEPNAGDELTAIIRAIASLGLAQDRLYQEEVAR